MSYVPKTAKNMLKNDQVRRQIQLGLGKSIDLAWTSIRVRLGRSLLVTSGIVLALAFLTYILASDNIATAVREGADAAYREQLIKHGALLEQATADARVQTYWMVGLALLVSFVGILNAMLMSVTERFAEIGTMKCLGALDSLIVRLFLLESFFQGALGTAVGIVIGMSVALLEGRIIFGAGVGALIPTVALMKLSGFAFLSGIALTVIGAVYPAWRAAKMEPVAAMRSEV
jgi:ABC-type antimicrobial peptide transport system permease subunit